MVYLVAVVLGVIGLFDNGFRGMLLFGAAPFGYVAISYFENQVFYLTTLERLFWWKFILKPLASFFVGPVAAPIIILRDIFYNFTGSKAKTE